MRLHHIGIASTSIESQLRLIRRQYDVESVSPIVYDEEQQSSVCMITINSGIDIELVEGERVKNLLAKGTEYYHICYEVEDLSHTIEKMTASGAVLVSSPKPARLFDGRKVAFLYTASGLIELLES